MGKSFSFFSYLPYLFTVLGLFCSPLQAAEAPLRLALLPIPDVFPIYVAEAEGYFREAGIQVEPLPVGSAVERDQLMQAGRVDGMINEISGAASFNRDRVQVQIVSVARAPLDRSPLFRILAAPGKNITSLKQLRGVDIGISKNTIIEYISTRMLTGGGLKMEEIRYRSVPVLPERLQLLLSGQLAAVTLPDPLAASAVKAGAVELVNDLSLPDLSASVVTFSTRSLERRGESVRKFMAAWDRAVVALNGDPERFRPLMLKKIRVPGNVRDDFPIPPMPRKSLPTEKQWKDVMAWMVERKLLKTSLPYSETVTGRYLPE